jgi:hypothetical protein
MVNMIREGNGVCKNMLILPKAANPRNSEGDFLVLKDERIMFLYTHFYEGIGSDNNPAYLAARFSSDGGYHWTTEDTKMVKNHAGLNVMSVSLLRYPNEKISMFYLRKNSMNDCRPVMRISKDEAKSWSDPIEIITDEVGYYVLNNDRMVQLANGRLIAPVALHETTNRGLGPGEALCYLSDDLGESWFRSKTVLTLLRDLQGWGLQEPGVIPLKDGRLMMFCRTGNGVQYLSYSEDNGDTWSKIEKSNITSPCSPASIKRIPTTGDLLLVWNNNYEPDLSGAGRRTPLNVAISQDEGETWQKKGVLEDDQNGSYCYTAVEFVEDRVLLGYCANDRRTNGLRATQITLFEVNCLYQ